MTCYHPLSAFDTGLKTKSGKPYFIIRPEGTLRAFYKSKILTNVTFIPCGKCIGCRLDYASTWSKRLMLEKSLYPDNQCHFLTLTYDDDNNPFILNKKDFQLFMKRLRKHFESQKIRFFMCGEYGSKTFRPHYHAIIFGLDIPDLRKIHPLDNSSLYTSDTILSIWNKGNIAIGDVTLKSCGYVAQYVLKKQISKDKDISLIQQPFTLMSRKPGIGAKAFDLSWYLNNEIILNGKTFKPGKFFNNIFESLGYSTDCFSIFNDMRIEKEFNSEYGFFESKHFKEIEHNLRTKILKQREKFK